MPKQIVFPVVLFLHNLFTVVWVGGLFTLSVTLMPAAKEALGMGPQMKRLMDVVQRRLSVWVYVSMVGLVLTGLLMSNRSPAFQGLFRFVNTYSTLLSVKHMLTLAMIAIALVRNWSLGPGRSLTAKQERLKALLLFVNAGLGVVVLLLSALCTAFS